MVNRKNLEKNSISNLLRDQRTLLNRITLTCLCLQQLGMPNFNLLKNHLRGVKTKTTNQRAEQAKHHHACDKL